MILLLVLSFALSLREIMVMLKLFFRINERYEKFNSKRSLAVDTILKIEELDLKLYQRVIQYSIENNILITAEVSLDPPNPGSDRFHIRHSFNSVGEFHQENKSVTMKIRDYQLNKNGEKGNTQ